jgi:hypothetical protein
MKNMKRIHKVVIKRMYDESPDTSWLGEYGQRAESDYAIDREHATDCPQQTYNSKSSDRCMLVIAYVDKLERAIAYLNTVLDTIPDFSDTPRNEAISEAQDLLISAQDKIQEEANACTCGGQHLDRNSYQFFNPNHENYEGIGHDETVKYCLQDYARMEALNNQEFCFIGIRAEADYTLTGSVMQEASSGGLWGIESDSSPEYIAEVEAEELAELRKQLAAIGFSSRAISAAFKTIEREEN